MVFKDNFLVVLLLTTVTVFEHSNGNNEFEIHPNRLQEANQPEESAPSGTRARSNLPQTKAASRFWYAVRGEADHFREETRDENGVVHGAYGYRTPAGIMRLVRYVADAKGFRAGISSNEPGVSQMEPSSVRLRKFSDPSGRTRLNSRIRTRPLNFVSSPVRTHLWGSNLAEFTPLRHNTNLYGDKINFAPETAIFHGSRRNNIQRTRQTSGSFGSPITKNTFFTPMNSKDVEYGTRNLYNSYPKFHVARATPIKLPTPPSLVSDSRRLPPWKRTSLVKKNTGVINADEPADIFTNSNDHFISSNTVKENGEAIKRPTLRCEKNCASKSANQLQSEFNNSGKETSTSSYAGHSGIQEHLSHSFSVQEKLSAVRTILQDYLPKDNITLPQLVYAKKLLQFYDLNGIVPPHLLPNSISVPSHSKRADAEVKALLDQLAEERWQYQVNQHRYKNPWRTDNGLPDIYQTEYFPSFQYPKRPFIQVLSPISVDIPDNLPHEKILMDRDSVPIISGGGSTNVNKNEHEGGHVVSSVPHSTPVEGITNKPQVTEHVSTSENKMDDGNNSLRQFVLRHFLLGKYASNQGIKSEENHSDENFMSNSGNGHVISSSTAGSTEKETVNYPVDNIEKSEVFPEFTTQRNVVTSPKESPGDEDVISHLLDSDAGCSENSNGCIAKSGTQDSEGSARTKPISSDIQNTSSLSPEYASTEYSGAFFSKPPQYPDASSTVSRYWQDNSFLPQLPHRGDHRLFKITKPERPLYDSRGQLVKPDAVPLHLHRFMPVKSSPPSSLGPFRFSIPRPVPPSSIIIPPKPPTVF